MKRLLVLAGVLFAGDAHAQALTYLPPGDLPSGSGQGRADDVIYAPTMLFPMQELPAFANSQVWGHGGSQGPGGGQCDIENYSFPWRDNYCETRTWDMPLCPSGTGHQGQDIRAATCTKDVHGVVAAENGTITNVGSYSVYLTAADGTRYDYLHMSNVQVSVGQNVARGDLLGMVSNEFGGTPTTIHLHFNIRQNVAGVGTVYVPPYTSLINAYQGLSERPIDGALEAVGCDAIVGWAYDPDDAEVAVDVPMVFDGSGVAHDIRADVYRGDLCENLSFCDHGFDVPPPYSLFDATAHEVDATNGSGPLPGSPLTMQCEPPALDGGRRPISQAAYGAWLLTAFWDEPPVAAGDVEAVSVVDDFPAAPALWRIDDELYVVDTTREQLRAVTPRGLRAWHLDASLAEDHTSGEMNVGDAWPERPLVVRDAEGATFVVDLAEPSSSNSGPSGAGGAGVGPSAEVSTGCSCAVVAPSKTPSAAWLLLLGVAFRRRQRFSMGT